PHRIMHYFPTRRSSDLAPSETADVSRGTNTVMLPDIVQCPLRGEQLVEALAVNPAVHLVVDHDGRRAGAVTEAIHRLQRHRPVRDRKSTRLNSSHVKIS